MDDTILEPTNDDGELSANPAAKIKELNEKLKESEREKQEYLDGWQRARADFVNAKRTEEKERAEFMKSAKENVLESFLELADSFEYAFGQKEEWAKADEAWRTGVESIYQKLLGLFKLHGVRAFGAVGDKIDLRKHLAVGTDSAIETEKEDTISVVVEKGYELNEKVLRPAKVRVYHING